MDDLNENQRKAVEYVDGPSLVIAGAGSGKTRVLTYKVAYLLDRGVKPWNILALTFTNKAAREMKERIAGLVGEERAAGLWMGTFHSVFSRILRMEPEQTGFSPRFTIYDQADSRNLVKAIVREMGLDEKLYKPATVAAHISAAKNRLVLPDAYLADRQTQMADVAAKIPMTGEVYRRYMLRLKQSDAMDFDDLLLHTYLLLRDNPEVCDRYAEKFDFVLVDEYQDTNYAQHCIVWELTRRRQRVCVVGDDAQSIYSFRGANIDNILNFSQKYSGAKVFKLEQNYRSTRYIVDAANSLISHNGRQIRKEVFSEKEKGTPIRVFAAYSDLEEAEIVAGKIAELRRKQNLDYDGFAILYRTNAQSRAFEEALRKRGMPYRIYGGLSFYQRKEVKDVIAYCRLVVNRHDEEAFKRVVNYPARGIGQATLGKIVAAASARGGSLWDAAADPGGYGLSVGKAAQAKLDAFTGMIGRFMEQAGQMDAASLIQLIIRESGMMKDIFQDASPEGMGRQENVQELLNGAQAFVAERQEAGEAGGLADFLQEVALLGDLDEDDGGGEGGDGRKVTLMTIHSAKGLEFPAVFVVGMEENLFPSPMAGDSIRALEEERRLFYVAVTRAERFCFLSFARSRFRFGKMEFGNPSRFLQDIDRKYLEMDPQGGGFLPSGGGRRPLLPEGGGEGTGGEFRRRRGIPADAPVPPVRATGLKPLGQRPLRDAGRVPGLPAGGRAGTPPCGDVAGGLRPGMRIEHERFGAGVVKAVEGSGENAKATVEFRNTGTKQLLLRFARFKVVE